ncbi:MAG: hypothetical protein IIB27_06470 [Chloroflexi bacterium]|nr:hypothetical protein [Chloroflexota bacterium]
MTVAAGAVVGAGIAFTPAVARTRASMVARMASPASIVAIIPADTVASIWLIDSWVAVMPADTVASISTAGGA